MSWLDNIGNALSGAWHSTFGGGQPQQAPAPQLQIVQPQAAPPPPGQFNLGQLTQAIQQMPTPQSPQQLPPGGFWPSIQHTLNPLNKGIPLTGGENSPNATIGQTLKAAPRFVYNMIPVIPQGLQYEKQQMQQGKMPGPYAALAHGLWDTGKGLEQGFVNAIAGLQGTVGNIATGNLDNPAPTKFLNSQPQIPSNVQAEQHGILPTAFSTVAGALSPVMLLEGLKKGIQNNPDNPLNTPITGRSIANEAGGVPVPGAGEELTPEEAAKLTPEQAAQLTPEQYQKAFSTKQAPLSRRGAELELEDLQSTDNIKTIKTGNKEALQANLATDPDLEAKAAGMTPEQYAITKDAIERQTANPLYGSIKIAAAEDWKDAVLKGQGFAKQPLNLADTVVKAAKGLSDDDVSLLDQLRTTSPEELVKQADNPSQFMKVAQVAQKYNDYTQEAGRVLGQSTPYRQQYGGRLFFDNSTPEAQDAIGQYMASLKTDPAYSLGRKFANYDDPAAQAFGLTRKYGNFLDDIKNDSLQRSNDFRSLALAKGMQEAYPGQAMVGSIGQGGKQLQIPGGQAISLPSDLADEVNARAPYEYPNGLKGQALKTYDAVNGFQKGSRLALGGFHDVVTQAGYMSQSVMGGDAGQIASSALAKLSPEAFDSLKQAMVDSGTMEKANFAGLTLDTPEVAADADSLLLRGKYNPIGIAHRSLFGREMPAAKLIAFDNATQGMSLENPADVTSMQAIANSLNKGIGGINRAVDGLTPTTAQQWSRVFLAVDYNEGQISSIIQALNPKEIGTPQAAIARNIIGGKMAIFATPGLVQHGFDVANGQATGTPEDWAKEFTKQIIDPQVHTGFTNAKGETKVLKFPGSPVGKLYRAGAPVITDKENRLSGIEHEATGNLAAFPSTLVQLKANKDYYGNPIIVKNDDDSLNYKQSLLNVLGINAPIPVNQIARTVKGQQTPTEAALNIAGIGRTAVNPNDPQYQQIQAHYKAITDYVNPLKGYDKQRAVDFLTRSKDPKGNTIQLSPRDRISIYGNLAQNDTSRQAIQKVEQATNSHDPMWNLPDDQVKTFLQYQAQYTGSDAKAFIAQQNPWIRDVESQRTTFYNSLQSSGKSVANPQTPAYPSFDEDTKAALSAYDTLAQNGVSGQNRAAFINQHPELIDAFSQLSQYTRAMQVAEGYPPTNSTPSPSPGVQATLDYYSTLPKGTGARSGWIKANPAAWGAMTQYLTQESVYQVAKNAALAQFEGGELNQKALKAIASLGKYDITQNPDGTYALGSGGSGTSSSRSSSRSGRIRVPQARITAKKPSGYFKKPYLSIRPSRLAPNALKSRVAVGGKQVKSTRSPRSKTQPIV